jgi:hypothetical protein
MKALAIIMAPIVTTGEALINVMIRLSVTLAQNSKKLMVIFIV